MTDETPQILPRKPGEPGGEKARVQAETVLGLVLLKLGFTTDHLTDGQLDRARDIVAGALAACALEAKGPLLELIRDMVQEMKPGPGAGGNDYHDAWQVFGERLERAAKDKS